MKETDEAIYRRYLHTRGEEDLHILFDRHREGLTLFLLGYVRNEADAEDLMMEAFAVAASGTARFSGRSSFKTWLFAIARHRAAGFLRKERRKGNMGREAPPEETAPPELTLLREEEKRTLYRAMETLPGDYRQALVLLYFEGMSPEEAGAVMGKTKGQMYNLTTRGRARLREALQSMGYGEATGD